MTLQVTAAQGPFKDEDGNQKWYPRLIKVGRTITSDDLARELTKVSTLSIGDARNVFDNLMDIIKGHLLDSKSVRLDYLGTFTVTCRARKTGVNTKEEVSPKQITDLKIRFTPSYTRSNFEGTTRAMFTGVDFEMYGARSKSTASGSNDNNGEGNDDGGEDEYIDPNA